MRTNTRKQENASNHEVALRGRRTRTNTRNSLQFFVHVEGVTEYDGRVRGANGIRWRLA